MNNLVNMTPMNYASDRPPAANPIKVMDLSLRDGVPMARLAPLQVKNDLQDWYQLGESQMQGLSEFER